jgi:hypothetical protein
MLMTVSLKALAKNGSFGFAKQKLDLTNESPLLAIR